MTAIAEHPATGWHARLDLGFTARAGSTVLARRAHRGPLHVQRAFYPEGKDCAHVYVLHPPGGVVGGDGLEINVHVESAAHALITTPAAGKFYGSAGATATQTITAQVAAHGTLEWLPQEAIVYDGARVQSRLRVELHESARFAGWEMLCLGRPGAGEVFAAGRMLQAIELWREGAPLVMDRTCYAQETLTASWGIAGHPVTGALLATASDAALLRSARDIIAAHALRGIAAATHLDDVIVCRYLGGDVQEARRLFVDLWTSIRRHALQRQACMPRIWFT